MNGHFRDLDQRLATNEWLIAEFHTGGRCRRAGIPGPDRGAAPSDTFTSACRHSAVWRGEGLEFIYKRRSYASAPPEPHEMVNGVLPALCRAGYAQLQKRTSFQAAVVDCEPPGARATFTSYAAQRRSEGTSVRSTPVWS